MSKWIEQGIHALLHRGLHEVIHYAGHELPKVIDEIGKTFNYHEQQVRQEQIRLRQIYEEEDRLRRQEEVVFKQLLDREKSERLILLHEIRKFDSIWLERPYHPHFDNPPSVKEFYDTRSSRFSSDTYCEYFAGATVEALKKVLRLKEEEREACLKKERETRLKEEREARLKAVIIFTSFFSALILGGSLIYNKFVSNIETTETTSSQTETGAK